MKQVSLGVNIDHVATLRQARGGTQPDVIRAAQIAEGAGADGITIHLREDRRHIQDRDAEALKEAAQTRLNLEMSIAPEIVDIACRVRPHQATLVPERRQELTTEGGLDVVKGAAQIRRVLDNLKRNQIHTSLFIDPDPNQVAAAKQVGAQAIELHTGRYANTPLGSNQAQAELKALKEAAELAHRQGLAVYAGHGLDLENVSGVVGIGPVVELNIGHSIVAHAVFVGLEAAVRQMKQKIKVALLQRV